MYLNETYNDKVVRQFAIMTVVWGIVGMAVGVLIAAQLYWPSLNFDVPWLTYSRLRPLHTNAVIFAFGGSALLGTSYYVVQRTCHVRLFSDRLAAFTFWGWQAVIVAAAITLPLGITQSKEYAELEWPIDLLITIVWVAYAVVFFTTIARRRVSHIYVANWFYASFIITIAVLHVFNNLAIPVSLTKSYVVYAGAIDAMMQWWYGHNAVGFFLTAGFLGMMYYFVPKAAQRPIYSYRLSVVHFWALISVYIWAGPHHLHYTSLPDWVQSIGMVFSLLLLAPSWGGMINGMLYITAMWTAGVVQGLMWRAFNDDGTLTYSFIESVKATYPFYLIRLAGGVLFLAGMLVMAWNVWMTVRHEKPRPVPVPAPAPEPAAAGAAAPLPAGAAASGAQP